MTDDQPIKRPIICKTCNGETVLYGDTAPPSPCPTCSPNLVLGPEWFAAKAGFQGGEGSPRQAGEDPAVGS